MPPAQFNRPKGQFLTNPARNRQEKTVIAESKAGIGGGEV
jgi:hypothetical protein